MQKQSSAPSATHFSKSGHAYWGKVALVLEVTGETVEGLEDNWIWVHPPQMQQYWLADWEQRADGRLDVRASFYNMLKKRLRCKQIQPYFLRQV